MFRRNSVSVEDVQCKWYGELPFALVKQFKGCMSVVDDRRFNVHALCEYQYEMVVFVDYIPVNYSIRSLNMSRNTEYRKSYNLLVVVVRRALGNGCEMLLNALRFVKSEINLS